MPTLCDLSCAQPCCQLLPPVCCTMCTDAPLRWDGSRDLSGHNAFPSHGQVLTGATRVGDFISKRKTIFWDFTFHFLLLYPFVLVCIFCGKLLILLNSVLDISGHVAGWLRKLARAKWPQKAWICSEKLLADPDRVGWKCGLQEIGWHQHQLIRASSGRSEFVLK